MEHNNKTFIAIGTLIVGVFIGWLMWGHQPKTVAPIASINGTGHMMPDGSMMGATGSSMGSMMDTMNAALEGKTGDTFDQEFLAEMIVHHQGAIDMAKLALTNAKHQEIKDLANAIIKAQTSEIAQMKAWQKTWYNQ